LKFHDNALEIRKKVLNTENDLLVAESFHNKALTLRDLGHFNEALKAHQKAL
jgi:hypothetical protein